MSQTKYTIYVPSSGGKAGKGRNKTTAIQVRNDNNCIVKQFRSKLDRESMMSAASKAAIWIESH